MAGKIKPSGVLKPKSPKMRSGATITGACLCGAVEIETDLPVFWAWHDHTAPSRRAHGAAYATYVGCWKSKVRVRKGGAKISTYDDTERRQVRSFCSVCGSPVMFARGRTPKMIDIPRALFAGRTGREAKYHIGIEDLQDWAYLGSPVGPLKGYPGVTVEKSRKKPKAKDDLFDPEMVGEM
ncbi:MAG: GFA family protein [Hyphomonadaceae bacterium]